MKRLGKYVSVMLPILVVWWFFAGPLSSMVYSLVAVGCFFCLAFDDVAWFKEMNEKKVDRSAWWRNIYYN